MFDGSIDCLESDGVTGFHIILQNKIPGMGGGHGYGGGHHGYPAQHGHGHSGGGGGLGGALGTAAALGATGLVAVSCIHNQIFK